MKRIMVMTAGVYFLFVCLVPPAHALRVVVARIISGKILVIGIKADRRADMFWEGDPVGTASRRGTFKFKTTNLPLDCVGELSDGVETIEVVVSGCEVSGLLATGQTVAFQADKNDGIIGPVDVDDDGTLQIGVPLQYVDNGDTTVTDLNTGLMWETKLPADDADCVVADQTQRNLHCVNNVYRWSGDGSQETIWDWLDDVNAENYAGHNDWRIPNIRGLHSIVDYGRSTPTANPILGPISSETWSSTTPSFDATLAILVEFNDGFVKLLGKTNETFRVRAVRGGL